MKTSLEKLLRDIQTLEWKNIIHNVSYIHRTSAPHNLTFCTNEPMDIKTQQLLTKYLEKDCEQVVEAYVTKYRVLIRYNPENTK